MYKTCYIQHALFTTLLTVLLPDSLLVVVLVQAVARGGVAAGLVAVLQLPL